jgi:flagellar biosynthetic protein FliS
MLGLQPPAAGAAAYNMVGGMGAAPQDLMKMGLDRACALLRESEAAIARGDRLAKARSLMGAHEIVEFLLGISGAEPGSLSECLGKVYRYALVAMLKGNATDDPVAIEAGRTALEELAAAWRRIFPDALSWAAE